MFASVEPAPGGRLPPLDAPGGPLSKETLAILRADLRFEPAIAAILGRIVGVYAGNRILNMVVNDRGRWLIGYMSMYLHCSRRPEDPGSGLTPSRIKAFCAENRLCSPGRAAAIVAIMRLAGFIVEARVAEDGRYRMLVPTERLFASFRERWRILMEGMAAISPDAARAASALERAEFMSAFVCAAGAYFEAGERVLFYSPTLSPIADQNSGMVTIFSLFPSGSEPPSVSSLARRFGISRPQVNRVLRAADELGLLEWDAAGRPVLSERGRESVLDFLAAGLSFQLHFARIALAQTEASSQAAA